MTKPLSKTLGGASAGGFAVALAVTPGLWGWRAIDSRAVVVQEEPFTLPCSTLPFEGIKKNRDIDDRCAASGDATEAEHQAQNRAKNNFCANGGPVRITHLTLRRLQDAVENRPDIECCGQTLPSNRSLLRNLHTTTDDNPIGEGTSVRLVGFLIKGKYSNVGRGKGESVNCHFEDREENDIHLNIVRAKPPANPSATQLARLECDSVVAEISPHFRPEPWEVLGTLVKTSANATAAKKIAALSLNRPMRFTGHLFFDASHRPCVGGTPQESSKRVSSWEIHPIYAIDVCENTSASACPLDREDLWIPLHEWLAADEEDDGSEGL